VHRLSKKLDGEVAKLHIKKLGAKLSKLKRKQADYFGVVPNGPFKTEFYSY